MEKQVYDFAIDEVLEIIIGRLDFYERAIELNGPNKGYSERLDELRDLYVLLRKLKYY